MELQSVTDISVCLVNLNTADLLRDCLHSIYEKDWRISVEVIVVDNASTDDSVSMIRGEFPQVKLIANRSYEGFSRGNNQAFAAAQGRYLLMLNTDTVIMSGAFDSMVAFMDSHAEAGALGPKLLNADGSLQRSCWRGFPSLKPALVDAFYLWRLVPGLSWVRASEVSIQELQDTLEVEHLLGAAMLIRREVIEEIGDFREDFIIFLEETDLCYRMKKRGWRVYFDPTAEIIHYGQQSVHKVPDWTQVQKYRNYYRFCRDHQLCSTTQLLLLKATFMAACVLRMCLWLSRMAKHGRDFSISMFKGYWTVMREVPAF